MKYLAFAVLVLTSPALAQQQLDPAFMQKALEEIANQRNIALNDAALARARVSTLEEEIKKLRAELDKKAKEPK